MHTLELRLRLGLGLGLGLVGQRCLCKVVSILIQQQSVAVDIGR